MQSPPERMYPPTTTRYALVDSPSVVVVAIVVVARISKQSRRASHSLDLERKRNSLPRTLNPEYGRGSHQKVQRKATKIFTAARLPSEVYMGTPSAFQQSNPRHNHARAHTPSATAARFLGFSTLQNTGRYHLFLKRYSDITCEGEDKRYNGPSRHPCSAASTRGSARQAKFTCYPVLAVQREGPDFARATSLAGVGTKRRHGHHTQP